MARALEGCARRLVTRIMRLFGRYPVCPENDRICDWDCADNLKCLRLYGNPYDWIPHVEGADRAAEINAYLKRMVDEMPIAKGPLMRWNPNTSRMEPYNGNDDLRG